MKIITFKNNLSNIIRHKHVADLNRLMGSQPHPSHLDN